MADQNRKIGELLDEAIRAIAQAAMTKAEKQALYQRLMTYLHELEAITAGGKDSPAYQKVEAATVEYVKVHGLFVSSAANGIPTTPKAVDVTASTATKVVRADGSEDNLAKFSKLVETCYRRGKPSPTELQLLDKFRQKYDISPAVAEQVMTQYAPEQDQQEAIYEFGLMYRAFLENDGDIDLEEQAQLFDLQEELCLTKEQVITIETNIREELVVK